MSTRYNPRIVTDNIVLHLDAANPKSYIGSGTDWKDLSGKDNDTTLVNSPTYSSNNAGYFNFDGTNDEVTLPTLDIAGNELTFSVWNYGIEAKYSSIIFLGDSGQNEDGRILQVHLPWSNNHVYFDKGWDGSSYDRMYKSVNNSQYQGWHHWAFTANATTGSMKIYLDSALWHSATGKTKTFSNVNGNIRTIGSTNYLNTKHYHRGYISNAQIYKKELSLSEVKQNYDALKWRYG